MKIGPYELPNNVIVAPMAGVTDRPFRMLCKRLGAGMAVSEMVASNSLLWKSEKTLRRGNHQGEVEPKVVQIAGAAPEMMAEAAKYNADNGAQIIDINMGCPAKKVCNVAAGSALMQNEPLVARILEAVVKAVDIPVTLKTRTGWDREHKNALTIARIAQESGIQSLAIHGRTRADQYMGEAEYDTVKAVKESVRIPVVANGDINSPEKAKYVLQYTGCDAVMVGRAAQGRPWIFREITHYLQTGERLPAPTVDEMHTVCRAHVEDLYAFYGEYKGLRIARKHVGWYTKGIVGAGAFRAQLNEIEDPQLQLAAVTHLFTHLRAVSDRLVFEESAGLALAA
jgi:tRNA-dihydrouridine synthase B